MNGTVPPYPKEYTHEHEGKQKLKKGICDVTAGARAGSVMDTSPLVGTKRS